MNASASPSLPAYSTPLPSMDILLVEDDPAIATALQYRLQQEGWQVTWVTTAAAAKQSVITGIRLAAVILDIGLPDGDGFGVCQFIRYASPQSGVPIVFLTARDDEVDKLLGLELGADDYITKPFSPREVVARLKAIWRREQLAVQPMPSDRPEACDREPDALLHQPTILTQPFDKTLISGRWQYHPHNYQLRWQGQVVPLSKTELAIMLVLLSQPTHILTREQLLQQISLHPEHRLARTIDSHIKSLRQKLASIAPSGFTKTESVIVTHRGLGYSLRDSR